MKPLVTIAIPTCNRSAYLRETLESVCLQDYDNLEVLVSDNGSEDDTASVVADISKRLRGIRYRRNATRSPLIPHFNQILAEARGEYFVLLSDDDRVSPNFISSLAGILTANERVSVAVPANVVIDHSGFILRTLPPAREEVMDGVEFVLDWLWRRCELPVANLVTIMGRTEMMRRFRYQPFPNGLNSDNLLFLQLALAGKVAFKADATFFWRIHNQRQASHTSPQVVNQAGRELRSFVRRDPALKRIIRSFHTAQQRRIRRGIERMTAEAYLTSIGFFDHPVAPRTLRLLPVHRLSRTYVLLILRHYLHLLREAGWGRRMRPVNI